MKIYRIHYTLNGDTAAADMTAPNIQTALQDLSRRIKRKYRGMFLYQVTKWELLS